MLKGLAAVPVRGVVFRDAWALAGGDAPGATISARNVFSAATLEPDTRIDYILVGWPRLHGVGQVLSARVLGDEAVGGLHGSDHFGVVADLRY
jgi:endonuclease/exonuclease/phosphatase family metal-dependent hydrolase